MNEAVTVVLQTTPLLASVIRRVCETQETQAFVHAQRLCKTVRQTEIYQVNEVTG